MGNAPSSTHALTVVKGSRKEDAEHCRPRLKKKAGKAFRSGRFLDAIRITNQLNSLIDPHKEPTEYAVNLDFLGKSYYETGDLDDAMKVFKQAMAMKQQHFPPNSPEIAKTLSNIGCIFKERGEYEQSLYLLQQAFEINQQHDKTSLTCAKRLTNMAIDLQQLGRQQEAIDCHLEAIKIKKEKAPESITLATSYINLANMLCHSKNPVNQQQAKKALYKAKQIAETQKDATTLVASLSNLGNACKCAADYHRAIDFYRQALQLEELAAPKSLHMAEICDAMANALEETGDLEAARKAKSRAIHIRFQKAPMLLETPCCAKKDKKQKEIITRPFEE
eukprot:CAMPEP_0197433028 /NCGR_PEP_ID=MMETSP1175-20131217/978_1 /TAXON_ID=1003142 /ORGANISM="Triceratium dubium, Strain CCMP147" /LENGTH=334 /DNA_ID=CAMNT_0042961273 /DNA_START=76 /DNA_END=1080 /DNA_ORIENTATION=+